MTAVKFGIETGIGAATGAGATATGGATAGGAGCSGVRHSTHLRMSGAHDAHAHTSPHGRNTTVAGADEHTTHSPTRAREVTQARHIRHFFT